MSVWERGAVPKGTHQPLFYFRFLDDIIGAWTQDISLFSQFIHKLKNHQKTMKVKCTLYTTQVHLLDTSVKISSGSLSSTLQSSPLFEYGDRNLLERPWTNNNNKLAQPTTMLNTKVPYFCSHQQQDNMHQPS